MKLLIMHKTFILCTKKVDLKFMPNMNQQNMIPIAVIVTQ